MELFSCCGIGKSGNRLIMYHYRISNFHCVRSLSFAVRKNNRRVCRISAEELAEDYIMEKENTGSGNLREACGNVKQDSNNLFATLRYHALA